MNSEKSFDKSQKKIIFLFLYGLHQLYHSAMTAMELGTIENNYEVLCLSCNDEHTSVLNKIKSFYPNSRSKIIQLEPPFRYKYLNFKKKMYPSVNAMIKKAKKILSEADAVVTTSHGTPKMLLKNKITKPKIIYQYHGCGDRRYGFDPGFKRFDFMLLPGKYHQDRLIEENIIKKDKTAIVGWPKFDLIDLNREQHIALFENENPTILYAPHWEPMLTSYNKFAEEILNYFKKNKQYNLIFAPHILIKHWKVHYNYNISYEDYNSVNILIDFGSQNSTNGTYLKYSDLYIGDVSSMVYEFIALKTRPCIFLNAHQAQWQNNPDYRFWDYGEVIDSMNDFEKVIKKSLKNFDKAELQKNRITEYFDINEERSSLRAAKAIQTFLMNIEGLK